MYIPIVKVDEERRLVYGRATDETPDAQGEVMDYESTKPQLIRWSQEQSDASGGRSLGNLRSMHGQIAAGLIKDLQMDDRAKAVDIVARVVDDNEWEKVCEGVLTSFSLGGKYLRRWPDVVDGKAVMRYTAQPSEISLVDRPANPNCRVYEVIKRDGTVRLQTFKSNEELNMFVPRDEDHCGRSTAASLIKAALGNPSGDLVNAFGKRDSGLTRRQERILQGVSPHLQKRLAKGGIKVKGPTSAGFNGAEGSSIDAIKAIHSQGARKMDPVSLPPQSANATPAPTATRADLAGGYPEYRTPAYSTPPLFGAQPQSVSEHDHERTPPGTSDQYSKTLEAIRQIHRRGPRPMWES